MSSEFYTVAHGKWILAGEHAVLRGSPALVFPLLKTQLKLHYDPKNMPLNIQTTGLQSHILKPLIEQCIQKGLEILKQTTFSLKGDLWIENNIPLGVGLGGSAALCLVIARWLIHHFDASPAFIPLAFAQSLENIFHGQSSGLDIAGADFESPLYFQKNIIKPFQLTWSPQWYLSPCGDTGLTAQSVAQVKALHLSNPVLAHALDEQMSQSVDLAYKTLTMPFHENTIDQLKISITHAADCFNQWGLITPCLQDHMDTLKARGAITVKPTGSGGGGYLISLWASKAPPSFIETSLSI